MARPKVRTDDVRERVLECALVMLEREGPSAISARRVAASARTSTGALYEFFGDKSGLVRALFFEGFASLRAALESVPERDGPRQYLVDLMVASRRFAVDRPMLFEVMYSRPFAEFSPDEEETEDGTAIYRMVVGAVRRWLNPANSGTSATDAAHVVVAAHRGLVMAELSGLAGADRRTIDARYRLGVNAVLDGLAMDKGAQP